MTMTATVQSGSVQTDVSDLLLAIAQERYQLARENFPRSVNHIPKGDLGRRIIVFLAEQAFEWDKKQLRMAFGIGEARAFQLMHQTGQDYNLDPKFRSEADAVCKTYGLTLKRNRAKQTV